MSAIGDSALSLLLLAATLFLVASANRHTFAGVAPSRLARLAAIWTAIFAAGTLVVGTLL